MNMKKALVFILSAAILMVGCGAKRTEQQTAVYLGILGYGEEETNKDNKENFQYRFDIGGRESVFSIDNGTKDDTGEYDYPIQNALKEGYTYQITIDDGKVVAAKETDENHVMVETPVSGTPGERTLKNFLKTAFMPVGTTLYIYGGGWDWQDVCSSIQARTLGVSPDWVRFFKEQDKNFTYKGVDGDEDNVDPTKSYYPYGGYNEYYYAGLDCSGYLGWTLYNTFETKDGQEGYVSGSTGMAKALSERGWGAWTQDISIPDGSFETAVKPGSIMSLNGHVWISLGTCPDGSILILHSTPTFSRSGQPGGGVQISAVNRDADKSCEAYELADKYMSEYYPEWYERYEVTVKDSADYLAFEGDKAGLFVWDTTGGTSGLTDPDRIQEMTAEEVLELLFAETQD